MKSDESYEQWRDRMQRLGRCCPHRLLTHNDETHPTAPLACRACPCTRFKR